MALTPAQGVLSSLRAPVVYVTGKGGVGKTTISAALALAAARNGERAALVEFDDDEAGQRALRGANAPVEHIIATFDVALEEAISGVLGTSLLAKTALKHPAVRKLTRAMPAMREFVSLEKIRRLMASGKYDRIIADLPASGHALDWLRVPGAFERFLTGGPLGMLGTRVHNEVVAKGKSEVVIVTLAEPLVIKETKQLAERMHIELGRRPSLIVVNRYAGFDTPGAVEAAEHLREASKGDPNAVEFAALMKARADVAADAMAAVHEAKGADAGKVVAIREAPTDPLVVDVLRWLDAGALS